MYFASIVTEGVEADQTTATRMGILDTLFMYETATRAKREREARKLHSAERPTIVSEPQERHQASAAGEPSRDAGLPGAGGAVQVHIPDDQARHVVGRGNLVNLPGATVPIL